jgi:hypothetical protein
MHTKLQATSLHPNGNGWYSLFMVACLSVIFRFLLLEFLNKYVIINVGGAAINADINDIYKPVVDK